MTFPNSPYQGDASQPGNGQFQQNQYQQQQPNGFAAPQQPQKKKGGCMKWGAIIVGVLVVLGIIINIAGGDSEDADSASSSSNSEGAGVAAADADTNEDAAAEADTEEADAEEGEAQSPELAPGQTYTTSKGLDITINSVTTTSDVFGTSYVAAEVTYLNNGDDEASFGTTDWTIQTPAGVVSDASWAGIDGQLDSGKLTPGGTVTGTVFFEGTDPGEYRIVWEPMFSFSSDTATWIANI
ncbi:DUF4352 domain-containing protein [Corynebacterium sp. J010B-136]|uniref:DUF4352 domain-containing protein n=1 Tax=Corynebacterium sp. J010B-136 TaxID=2099401 RepID=UPI000CF92610|nr:DUF4352 domain-containing protein [Corynebacterium sp. J010B-136]PQM73372.1 hypothetical protein C5Y44_12790 [Corynebacterium sp. J010B-136]